jgi:hypothetical protein
MCGLEAARLSEKMYVDEPAPADIPMPDFSAKSIWFRKPTDSPDPGKSLQPDSSVKSAGVTAMIRNIPCRFTPEEVVAELNRIGLAGTYDGFYMPGRVHKTGNLGYCFVQFSSKDAFVECCKRLSGRSLGQSNSAKKCEVTLADLQGSFGKEVGKLGMPRPRDDAGADVGDSRCYGIGAMFTL